MIDTLSGFFALIVGTFLTWTSPVHRAATECGTKDRLAYCYYRGDERSNQTVYFLHGFGNDVKAWGWNSVTKNIEEVWSARKLPRPHVMAFSYGQIWWYNPSRGKEMVALMKELEVKHMLTANGRTVYGDSMGGHNSYHLAGSYPGLFTRMALICPGFPQAFTDDQSSAGIWPVNWSAAFTIQRHYGALAEAERNPLKNQKILKSLESLKGVFIVVSKDDHFGFYPGGLALYQTLKKHSGTSVTLEEQGIFHCRADAKNLAPFLAEGFAKK